MRPLKELGRACPNTTAVHNSPNCFWFIVSAILSAKGRTSITAVLV
jgi:hypothetical protein